MLTAGTIKVPVAKVFRGVLPHFATQIIVMPSSTGNMEVSRVSAALAEAQATPGAGRARLCSLPTPLVEAARLTEALGGPQILIKRDDLTGLALGGNKSRACEFVLGQAMAAGHNVVIAVGPQHSNQLCAIAAAAKKCGMEVILLLLKGENRVRGNLLLFHLMGADVRFTHLDISRLDEVYEQMAALAVELQAQGAHPVQIKYGPLPVGGLAGYLLLFEETFNQLAACHANKTDTGDTHIFVGSGSGLTQSGFVLGNQLLGAGCRIYGVGLDERFGKIGQERNVLRALEAASDLLTAAPSVDAAAVRCIPGYNQNDTETREKTEAAIRLTAQTEGVFLDPIYTGRVMAALIDHIRAGQIPPEDTIVFYHSGGIPAVFSHCEVRPSGRVSGEVPPA